MQVKNIYLRAVCMEEGNSDINKMDTKRRNSQVT